MFTKDIHSNKETVKDALYELDSAIKLAKQTNNKILCLITGYGSHNTSHKIKTGIEEKLDEYIKDNKIKSWINGNDLDIFNKKYQDFKNNHLIPEDDKKRRNPGVIYISL